MAHFIVFVQIITSRDLYEALTDERGLEALELSFRNFKFKVFSNSTFLANNNVQLPSHLTVVNNT